jgi:hypothetical protein
MRIRLSELQSMSEEKRDEVFRRLAETVSDPDNGETARDLDSEIAEYERRHNISSSDMKSALDNGTLKETPTFARG